jgi:probable rRNA maturation factor
MAIRIKNLQRSKSLDLRRVSRDLAKALALLGLEGAELSVLFVGSAKMKSLNSAYRGIPRETDVLSFAMNEGKAFPTGASGLTPPSSRSLVLGDIVISVPRTVEQAAEYGVAFGEELIRLLIHGLLHLAGYDHEKGRQQRLKMEKKERELLHALQGMD